MKIEVGKKYKIKKSKLIGYKNDYANENFEDEMIVEINGIADRGATVRFGTDYDDSGVFYLDLETFKYMFEEVGE